MTGPCRLETHPIHLGLGGRAGSQPAFTGIDWYEEYGRRTTADGVEGRLVSMYTFDESWDSWERHPAGDEVVVCVAGAIRIVQEQADGSIQAIDLQAGDYAINPPGVWHTADVDGSATCLFITAGMGTDHRPR
jgi:quercetin dioxygenase-like cupin family protein